ncbi:hypothetical protein ACN38_g1716 [Penicillium nordicum]|uniref:Uncharacterized protein n=1 Tax=Penicillium nordicum TaxID=229535 RepID=A0A0M9WJK9_9EURO|nr:hypothetical protein ACN38_g1716 [Penicillium nordicum]
MRYPFAISTRKPTAQHNSAVPRLHGWTSTRKFRNRLPISHTNNSDSIHIEFRFTSDSIRFRSPYTYIMNPILYCNRRLLPSKKGVRSDCYIR